MHTGVMVTAIGKVRVMPDPEAVIVRLETPAAAWELAFNVSVLEIDPAGMVAGEKVAVKPAGPPLTESSIAELNPPLNVRLMVVAALDPGAIETAVDDALSRKDGPDTAASLQ